MGLPQVMQLGIVPRRDWSFRALMDSYLPSGLFYMNMYYLIGTAKSFEMLKCLGGVGEPQYLAASPAILCWQVLH